MTLSQRVKSSIQWLIVGQFIAQLVRISVTFFVIGRLENDHMGFVTLAQSVEGLVAMFSSLGIAASIISNQDIGRKDIQNLQGLAIALNVFLILVIVGFSSFIADFYDVPEIEAILRVSAIGFLFSALIIIPEALLSKAMEFKKLSLINVAAGFAGAVVSFLSIVGGLSYWALVLGGIAIQFTKCILVNLASRSFVFPRFAFSESLPYIKFGGFVMGTSICFYLYTSFDLAITAKFWSIETVGIYAVAIQIAVMPLNRLLPLFKQVALPAYSITVSATPEKLENYMVKSLRLTMSLVLPFYFGLAVVTPQLISLVFDEKWFAVIVPLQILCLAAPVRFARELIGPAILASGYAGLNFTTSLIITISMLSSYFLVVLSAENPAYLALVWLTVYPLASYVTVYIGCRAMNIRITRLLAACAIGFFSSCAMMLLIFSTQKFMLHDVHTLLELFGSILVGIASYTVFVYLFDKKLFTDLWGMIFKDSSKKSPLMG